MMTTHSTLKHPRMVLTLMTSLVLAACGGNAPEDLSQPMQNAQVAGELMSGSAGKTSEARILSAGGVASNGTTNKNTGTSTKSTTSTSTATSTTTSTVDSPVPVGDPSLTTGATVTDVKLVSTSLLFQSDVAVTFGQVFKPGDVPAGSTVVGKLEDGNMVPLQVDAKAFHADGSLRHGVISTILPSIAASQTRTLTLVKTAAGTAAAPATPAALINNGFNASVTATIGGVRYSASADNLLKQGKFTHWLGGAVATEWLANAPLVDDMGNAHKHLTARFAVRSFAGSTRARVDVTIENNWAYEPAPQNFTYDAAVVVGGQTVFSKAALTHYHHARWRKTFWWGGEPSVHVKHNSAYLMASRALPNYDASIVVPETALAAIKTKFSGAATEPMALGMAIPYMPQTGGRNDIGIMPAWAATYLVSMDKRAKDATLGTADLAGSWSSHYRNKNTDRPVTLFDYPYMTTLPQAVNDTLNKATGQKEAFPACATSTACTTPYTHDASHQPGFAYLPYVVTGDYYYLEELQFWASWNTFWGNPAYREYSKGLLKSDQVRGQAWSMRTLAQAAYITPNSDPLKAQFTALLNSNLDWYNANYTNNASANKLGVLVNGAAIVYDASTGVAPWQDDFFTAAIGLAAELGFDKASQLMTYKSKFVIDRMSAPGSCWIDGAKYSMKVRDSSTAPLYTSFDQVYAKSHTLDFLAMPCASSTMATFLRLKVGEMTGYSAEATGYPSNMQPALAYAASQNAAGATAWKVFMARTVKPNYGLAPQFAIVPR
jgi:hypothetical protein